MDLLIEQFESYIQLSSELKNDLKSLWQERTLKKGERLLEIDEVCRNLYFIESGTLRTFYYIDGKDATSWFYQKEEFITSWSSYFTENKSTEMIEATETTSLYYIKKTDLESLYDKHTELDRFGRKIMEHQVVFLEEFYKGFMFMNATDKYLALQSFYPNIEQHVNLSHIASFLGLTLETLSRLRKKIMS